MVVLGRIKITRWPTIPRSLKTRIALKNFLNMARLKHTVTAKPGDGYFADQMDIGT